MLYDKLYAGGHVLDVGSGSGYLTACFARAVRQKEGSAEGVVVGIEHQPQLVNLALENIRSDDAALIESGQVVIIGNIIHVFFSWILFSENHLLLPKEGDGRLGYPEMAPYDAIHVGAAAPDIPLEVYI